MECCSASGEDIGVRNHKFLAQNTYVEPMSNPTDPENSVLSEPMVARLEIEQLGDAASEKQITDAVTALNGVSNVKVEKDALFDDRKED